MKHDTTTFLTFSVEAYLRYYESVHLYIYLVYAERRTPHCSSRGICYMDCRPTTKESLRSSRLSPFKKSVDVYYKTFNYYSVLMICLEPIVENSAIVNRQSPSEVVGYRNKLGIENRNTFPCSMICRRV